MEYLRWEAFPGIKELGALGGQRTLGGLRLQGEGNGGKKDKVGGCAFMQAGKMAGMGWADTEELRTSFCHHSFIVARTSPDGNTPTIPIACFASCPLSERGHPENVIPLSAGCGP